MLIINLSELNQNGLIHNIEQLAMKFRKTILDMNINEFDNSSWFANFPFGCCGDTCNLFSKYLERYGIKTEYVWGFRGEKSHAWLEYKGIIIDLTADQFEEISDPLIISKDRNWHDNFKPQKRSYNDFQTFEKYNRSRLSKIYKCIIKRMEMKYVSTSLTEK